MGRKKFFFTATLGLLSLMFALVWLGDVPDANAQVPTHVFKGRVLVDGKPAPDGTPLRIFVGRQRIEVADTKTVGGRYEFWVVQPQGDRFQDRVVEFAMRTSKGGRRWFPQTTSWQPDEETIVVLKNPGRVGTPRHDLTLELVHITPHAQVRIFRGEILLDSGPAPDGTLVMAFIDGVRVISARSQNGNFEVRLPPWDYKPGKIVAFIGRTVDGRELRFPQIGVWQPGRYTPVNLQWQDTSSAPVAEEVEVHIFRGPALLSGQPVSKETTVFALINGVRVAQSRIRSGRFHLEVIQPISLTGKAVEFYGMTVDGRKIRFPQTVGWQPGGETVVSLERSLQRGPSGPGRGQSGSAPNRPQQEETYVVQGSASFEGLKVEDGTRVSAYIDGVRISGTIVNDGRFRLVVPQEQGESFAGKVVELRSTVRGNRVSWPQRPTWQPGGETTLTLEASADQGSRGPKPDQARNGSILRRGQQRPEPEVSQVQPEGGQPPGIKEPAIPSADEPVQTGPTRGFFTNSQIGQLGSVNELLDPATLAVIGILITLAATTMQMMRGN